MVTLADIAKQAEVSTGTVSRVLNNKTGVPISQPTIDRIKRAAQDLGYRPNALARALATGKTGAIGLCYRSITEPMFIRILEAAEATSRERGYHLIVSSDVESFAAESRIDGLIYVGFLDNPRVRELARHKPVMFVSPSEVGSHTPNTVTWSESHAAFMAVQYLAELGHRTVGALWGDFTDNPTAFPRVAGFRAALSAFGVAGVEAFEERDTDLTHRGYLQMGELMGRDDRPTAVFARNDHLALGALRWLHEARIAVPEEMSLIYYGNSVLANAAYIRLTSVSHPNAEASVIALNQLIAMIDGGAAAFPNVTLPITRCEGDSCAPPRRSR